MQRVGQGSKTGIFFSEGVRDAGIRAKWAEKGFPKRLGEKHGFFDGCGKPEGVVK